jgi:hypothetical protein
VADYARLQPAAGDRVSREVDGSDAMNPDPEHLHERFTDRRSCAPGTTSRHANVASPH